jgi:hypothetical protein
MYTSDMRLIFLFTFLSILYHLPIQCQVQDTTEEKYQNFWQYGKEVGLNVTKLASRFVPLNLTNKSEREQIIALKTKWYGRKRAFILNVGFDLTSEESSPIFISLGYERRRHISAKWKYTTGWEVFLGSLRINEDDIQPLLGISKPYGIEYHFNDNFYLSTEARLIAGAGDDINLKILYPSSIFFNMLID